MTLKTLTTEDLYYYAGFIDGDGCVNAQIVRRQDYVLGFQIRVSVTLFQKTTRHWFLVQAKKRLGLGTLRKRPDGITELAIVGAAQTKALLEKLLPYLRIKRRQAELVLEILEQLSRSQDAHSFAKLCDKVDSLADFNDSKRRTLRATVVRSELGLDQG